MGFSSTWYLEYHIDMRTGLEVTIDMDKRRFSGKMLQLQSVILGYWNFRGTQRKPHFVGTYQRDIVDSNDLRLELWSRYNFRRVL